MKPMKVDIDGWRGAIAVGLMLGRMVKVAGAAHGITPARRRGARVYRFLVTSSTLMSSRALLRHGRGGMTLSIDSHQSLRVNRSEMHSVV